MSFSKPKQRRPYTKTIEWKGSNGGHFSYYDGEMNKTIELGDFIVLEEKSAVSGWHDRLAKGIWSNDVSDLQFETLEVRAGREVIAKGSYMEIKDEIKAEGGRFTKVVYALVKGELVRIMFAGSGVSGWIDKGFEPCDDRCGVRLSGTQEGKKGNVTFFSPQFEPVDLKDDQIENAIEESKKLDSWFASLKSSAVEPATPEESLPLDDANAALQEASATPPSEEVPF